MSIFVIPRHKRFAVRQKVQLRGGSGLAQGALLIEVSLNGCRVSVSDLDPTRIDQPVTVEIEGFGDIRGHIRSASESIYAIRFARPIQSPQLHQLIWSPSDEAKPILQLPAFATAR